MVTWAPLEPLPAAAIEWATVLTATALPEGQPYPPLYQALDGLLDRMLGDATAQLERIRDLINQTKADRQGGS